MGSEATPIRISPIENGCKIEIIGGVHTNVAWLETELKKIVADKPPQAELDLSHLTFLSSTGIGVLSWFRNSITKDGGQVRIVAVQHQVLDALRYARLLELFQIGPATVVSHH